MKLRVHNIFRPRQKSWVDDDLIENEVVDSNACTPSTSNGCNIKECLELKKFPIKWYHLYCESEAMNNEVLSMLKIYLDSFYNVA